MSDLTIYKYDIISLQINFSSLGSAAHAKYLMDDFMLNFKISPQTMPYHF